MRTAFSLAALALAITLVGCESAPEAAPARAESASTAPRVVVVRPKRATIRHASEQPGQIEAYETAPLHARIGGYVREVGVDIGDRVKKGQVLASLDVPEVEAERDRKKAQEVQAEADRRQAEAAVAVARAALVSAEAGRAEAQAGVPRAEADVARWRSESGRADQLVRESAATGSLRDEARNRLASAEAGRDEARAKLRSAEAAVVQAGAGLDKAGADLAAAAAGVAVARFDARRAEAMAGFARIVAPFDGVVTRRLADPGHLTVPGGTGAPLLVVARTDPLRVAVGVPEIDAALIRPGAPAEVRLPALDGRTVVGRVARTSWALDPATRTLRAEVDLPNPDGQLQTGLYAHVTIFAEGRRDALTVPAAAVVRPGGRAACWVVSGGRARRRDVQVGLSDGARTEVLSGLDGGEDVAISGVEDLSEGQPVQAAPPDEAAKPKA